MKKMYGILIAAGILLATVTVTAMADPVTEFDSDYIMQENAELRLKNRQQMCNLSGRPTDDSQHKMVSLRGIWGHFGDNESDGYFGARITRRNRVGFFNGFYNTTGNESKIRLVGIMRYGYFNGKIITEDGGRCPVIGLYKVDQEKQLFKLRWMAPHGNGWGVARIITT
jgi:hypothetical protein